MNRKKTLLLAVLTLCLLLGGCAPEAANPLVRNQATALPGLSMELHAASAGDTNTAQVNATLYFRYMDEPMLASENRVLSVRRDESAEYAIVQALLDGPSTGHSDLKRLLPAAARLESVTSRGDILFVTFDASFLDDDVPENWADDSVWRGEAPLLRKLAVQSLVASITESFAYTGVQILVHKADEVQTSLRLENAYFLTGQSGLSEPIAREEALLLTPQHTAQTILTAWQQHDFERMYRFVAELDKPAFAAFSDALGNSSALEKFDVSGGSVSDNGQTATLAVSLRTLQGGSTVDVTDYPLQLVRENGVWKITNARLAALLAR